VHLPPHVQVRSLNPEVRLLLHFQVYVTWCLQVHIQVYPGFPIVRPVRAKVSPGPDDNFRGKQTKDCLGLGQQSHGRKDCRALQSSSAHCARRYYNTNMITYKQTRPSAHYQASSIHNCSSSASICMSTNILRISTRYLLHEPRFQTLNSRSNIIAQASSLI